MRAADWRVIAGTACTTMLIVLAGHYALIPALAGNLVRLDGATAGHPFTVGDTTFTLDLGQAALTPGEVPEARLVVTNTGRSAVTHAASLSFTATAPTSPLSRMVARPQQLWSAPYRIALAPGETRTLDLAIDKPVPVGQVVAFTVAVGDRAGTLATFAEPRPDGSTRPMPGLPVTPAAQPDARGQEHSS